MYDLISRYEALEDLRNKDPNQIWSTADVEAWLNALPSAKREQKILENALREKRERMEKMRVTEAELPSGPDVYGYGCFTDYTKITTAMHTNKRK